MSGTVRIKMAKSVTNIPIFALVVREIQHTGGEKRENLSIENDES